MTVILKIGRVMVVEGMIEAAIETTIEAAVARPPTGVVRTDAMMITATVITGVITTMETAVEAATVVAEEAYTLAV